MPHYHRVSVFWGSDRVWWVYLMAASRVTLLPVVVPLPWPSVHLSEGSPSPG
jgi:hypothetical protein